MENEIHKIPSSDDSEKAVLGSVLINSDEMSSVQDILVVNDFYNPRNKTIYKAMLDISAEGHIIDNISLSEKLKTKGDFDAVGGTVYMLSLVEELSSASNAEFYAKIVKEKSIRRTIIQSGQEIAKIGYSEDLETLEDVVNKAEKELFTLVVNPDRAGYIPLSISIKNAAERYERLSSSPDGLRGISTGFSKLDDLLSGLQNSDLVIVAARPSVGKTAFALDVARKAAIQHGTKVALFSLEMSEQQLVDRMIASQAHIDSWALRTGKLASKGDAIDKFKDALDSLSKAPIYIDNNDTNSISKIRATSRRMKKELGIEMIIVDYLQLILPSVTARNDSVVAQITEISRALKQMALELDVPVVALSQLSRAIEHRQGEPRLSDLRDSGSIEQDADIVMFLHKPYAVNREEDAVSNTDNVQLRIEKHRNGPLGVVKLMFDKKKVTFSELDKHNE